MNTENFQLGSLLLRFRAVVALLLLAAIFAILSPEFLTAGNLMILVKHVAINAVLAVGMTFVILTGGIDLSVGSIAGVTGIVAGLLISSGLVIEPLGVVVFFEAWMVVVIALMVATAFGALNGVLVAKFKVPPFVATLGSLYVARGAALLLSNGATFPNLGGKAELGNQGFLSLGGGSLLGLPAPIWIMVGLVLIAWLVAEKTPFGRRVYAVGSNERAARLSGVRVGNIQFAVYAISGACAGLVGLIIASSSGPLTRPPVRRSNSTPSRQSSWAARH